MSPRNLSLQKQSGGDVADALRLSIGPVSKVLVFQLDVTGNINVMAPSLIAAGRAVWWPDVGSDHRRARTYVRDTHADARQAATQVRVVSSHFRDDPPTVPSVRRSRPPSCVRVTSLKAAARPARD